MVLGGEVLEMAPTELCPELPELANLPLFPTPPPTNAPLFPERPRGDRSQLASEPRVLGVLLLL